MGIKLGDRERCLTIREKVQEDPEQQPEEAVVKLFYREPKTKQKVRYLARGNALSRPLEDGSEEAMEAILQLQIDSAAELLLRVEGFDFPEGQDPVELMKEYGGDYLRILSRYVFEGGITPEFERDLGKSVMVSSSS